MQDDDLSAGRVASKEAEEVMEGAYRALPGAVFPFHIAHFLSNIFVDLSLFGKSHRIPLNQ